MQGTESGFGETGYKGYFSKREWELKQVREMRSVAWPSWPKANHGDIKVSGNEM